MPCKTRQAARAGKRSIPHLYLRKRKDRRFTYMLPRGHNGLDGPGLGFATEKERLEARIDWSTWGASR